MKYCRFCGTKMKDDTCCCPCCGEAATIDTVEDNRKISRVTCSLAYLGTLFWIPLIFSPKSKNAKICANQGLWSLIGAILAFVFIRITKMLCRFLILTPLSFLANPITVLSTMLFLFFMLYLVVMSWKNAMAVRRDEDPRPMLFFDSYAIIK